MNNDDAQESIISTLKAISQIKKVNINFNNQEIAFTDINQDSFLAHDISLPSIYTYDNLCNTRGFADLAALYLRFHNSKIHQQYLPNDESKNLFNDLEKFRLIKKGSEEFKGIVINLEKILIENLQQVSGYSFLPFLLLKTFSTNDLKINIAVYKKNINKDLLGKINELSKLSDDQQKFSYKALKLIEFLNQKNKKNQQKQPQPKKQDKTELKKDNKDSKKNSKEEIKIDKPPIKTKNENKKETLAPESNNIFQEPQTENSYNNKDFNIKFIPQYRVFTKKFDQIIKANDLSNKDELINLRHQFDLKLKKLEKISKKLTAKLKQKLLAKKQISYQFNKEEGLIDRKKMTQIVTKPFSGNHYLTINEERYQNTILSILLDNSGSMRGIPIIMTAMVVEIIAQIFESFRIKIEILGFTTSDWRGGKSRKLWEEKGKPQNPGRLSDLRHIVYKNAHQSFKNSKNNLALMLKDGVLKENIDGEALIWARKRLQNSNERRKILLVISDGTPVDDSTNSNNDDDILNNHLHQTIHNLEKHSQIEIAAIGIGHNVGDFYKNSIMVKNIEELGDAMIEKILLIID